jgi:hypothetical protein
MAYFQSGSLLLIIGKLLLLIVIQWNTHQIFVYFRFLSHLIFSFNDPTSVDFVLNDLHPLDPKETLDRGFTMFSTEGLGSLAMHIKVLSLSSRYYT